MAVQPSEIAVVATPPGTSAVIVPAAEPVTSQSTGFITYEILGYHISINPMLIILFLVLSFFAYFLWKAQRNDGKNTFDAWDLVMDELPDGKRRASGIKLAFQVCFLVSTWTVIDKELKNSLDAAFFAVYSGVWSAALIGKIVYDQKQMPDLNAIIKGKTE